MVQYVGTSTNKGKQVLFKAKDLSEEHDYPELIPVPPYMVYDGFTANLDALAVYKPFLHACKDAKSVHIAPLRHALEFLRLGVISATVQFNNITLPHNILQA